MNEPEWEVDQNIVVNKQWNLYDKVSRFLATQEPGQGVLTLKIIQLACINYRCSDYQRTRQIHSVNWGDDRMLAVLMLFQN